MQSKPVMTQSDVQQILAAARAEALRTREVLNAAKA